MKIIECPYCKCKAIDPASLTMCCSKAISESLRESRCGSRGGKAKRGWANSEHIQKTFEKDRSRLPHGGTK